MHREELTLAENNSNVKKEKHVKGKKRKFSSISNDSAEDVTCRIPKMFKNRLSSEEHIIPESSRAEKKKSFYCKSTINYTKVIAKPGKLQSTPKIFQISKPRNNVTDNSDSFLFNFLSEKSFNININERFNQGMISNNRKKIKKKINNKKVIMEESADTKLKNLSNESKEKKKNKKQKVQGQKTLLGQQNEDNCLNKEENVMSCVDMYSVSQSNALIFHMHHPSKFSFHGEIKVTVIKGEVEVLGFTLGSSSSKNSADIYSPKFFTPLIVETKFLMHNILIDEEKSRLRDLLKEDDYNELLTNLKPQDSVLLIEEIISSFGIVINKYFDKPLFPKDLEDISTKTETLKSLQSIFTFKLPKMGRHFRKSPEWDKIPLGHCTVLCGGKGVGKSTLLKYYINKLFTLGEKILCLDFDPGQPEFTFPGCVSAVVINQPLLGPNFTHILDPVVMMNFGNVDVSSNPIKYLECVKYIIESCEKNEELLKMKWFVNTMGFCKGLGVNLMITILKLLKPDTVIQIRASDYKNNYPFYLTPITLNSKTSFISMPLNNVNLSYDLRLIYTCAEHKKKQLQGELKPKQIREIMCISYFSKMVSHPFYNFNAVQPYLISFSKLYLGIDFLIEPNQVLKAFNGNIVSLSHFEPDNEEIFSVESEEDVYFKVVVKPSIAPSLGIGLVRGIDCQEKKFYIMTHLPIETLESVNCLSLGRINPSHSMFLKQDTVEGQKVYTTPGTIDVIQKVKRTFRVSGIPQKKENINL